MSRKSIAAVVAALLALLTAVQAAIQAWPEDAAVPDQTTAADAGAP